MRFTLYFILFIVCTSTQFSFGQPSKRQVKNINKFNYLLGDHYTVDESMIIHPVIEKDSNFKEFKEIVSEDLWKTGFHGNTDTIDCIKNNIKNIKVLNITMNSAGLLYPMHLQDSIKNSTFNHEKFLQKVEKDKKNFRKDVFNDILKYSFPDTDEDSIYYKLKDFNDITTSYYIDTISKLVGDTSSINKIYFFIHGYNVPVGLAQLQGNRFIKMINDYHLKEDETALFIRVFWDAEKLKIFNVKIQEIKNKNKDVLYYKLKRIAYRDKFSLRNAIKWKQALHQSQHCGLSLRTLFVKLSNDDFKKKDINIITHSQGGFLAVNALTKDINNIVYLNHHEKDSLYQFLKKKEFKLNSKATEEDSSYFKKKYTRAWYVYTRMSEMDTIKLDLDLFLNAPALAGSSLNSLEKRNNIYSKDTIIVGYNYFDPTLSKRFIFKGKAISRKRSKNFESTSLGIDFDNDVLKTYNKFKKDTSITFIGVNTSNYFEHDIFYYTRHPLFKMEFKKMK